ncbi:hypothetical protein [Tenacibaculum aiptasiae]|uniref:hypothetical protein n=1 Tax=Tenacibaculum aiptasiae TaxID=426481 RepID=UPI003B5A8951
MVVSNAGTGCTSVTSNKSTVTVNALPTIDTSTQASTSSDFKCSSEWRRRKSKLSMAVCNKFIGP